MNFNDGTEEYEDDGKKLGHSSRVVLNPHTWEVTDIVVHSGYFFTTDKVISVDSQALALDSEVIASDGKCVGHMQEAFQESTTHLASHNLISQSLLLLCWRRHDDAPLRPRSSDLDSQHPSAFEHLDTPAFISYLSWPDGRTKE